MSESFRQFRAKVPNIVLVGATASGKSTVGYQLARLTGLGYLDLDEWIAKRIGKSVADIFATDGEAAFRQEESSAITALSQLRNHVIVTGAGVVESPEAWERLKKLGILVWLATPVETIVARLLAKPEELKKRPLLAQFLGLENLAERSEHLRSALDDLALRREASYREAPLMLNDGYATPETGAFLLKGLLLEHLIQA